MADRRTDRWAGPQAIRWAVAAGFLVFTLGIGIQFALFVEQAMRSPHVSVERPASVEAFLPISSLTSLTYLAKTGVFPTVRPAGLIIFSVTLLLALAIGRGFCSWVCPFGPLSELAWKLGTRILGRNPVIPRGLDIPLRGIKFALLGFFLYVILPLPADALEMFIGGPYNRIADAKMLYFFAPPSRTAIIVLAALVVLSLVFKNVWCRYLCPYGALLGILSLAGPLRVRRDPATCIDCGRCTRACPQRIPVADRTAVRSLECTSCYACIESCPVDGCLSFRTARRRAGLSPLAYGIATVLAFVIAAGAARTAGYWQTDTPIFAYHRLLQRVQGIDHPRTAEKMRQPLDTASESR